jgi:lipopolysaccharide transport system permease protein
MSTLFNPHQAHSTSFKALIQSLVKNRQLIYQMTRREVVGRYKGSMIGLAWSFFNPLLMLVIYTFVFSVVFKSRWGAAGSDSKTEFATILFVGMIVFNLFAETINRAPTLILSNVNYVKKVVFPLEILPAINLGAALFHTSISFGVLICALILFNGYLHWTVVFLPIVLLPFIFLIMGISWFIASLGVYACDVSQAIGVITTLTMFLSPVFYPISAVPQEFQRWILINPLSFMIEQARNVLLFGDLPNWFDLSIYCLASTFVMYFGFAWFQKTKKGFADVL